MTDLGKVGIMPKGEYVDGVEYERLDVVYYDGSSYLALTNTAVRPIDDRINWMLLVEGTPIGTEKVAGKVKPDGTTITVDEDGTIHGAKQVPDNVLVAVEINEDDPDLPPLEAPQIDADCLGGELPEYYATKQSVTDTNNKIGTLNDLQTENKMNLVESINEMMQELSLEPIRVSSAQNPETFEPGHVYTVDTDETYAMDGHPLDMNFAHVTYFVYGEEENKVIIASYGSQNYTFIKTQYHGDWAKWFEIANDAELRYSMAIDGYSLLGIEENGNYYIDNAEDAPSSAPAGYLTVINHPEQYDNYRIIFWRPYSGYKLYTNRMVEGSWLGWQRIISDKDLPEMVSGTNILINSDFRHPINQRGETVYTDANVYTIDRWKFNENNSNKLEIKDGYITLSSTDSAKWKDWFQIIDNPSDYKGKYLTFSAKARTKCDHAEIELSLGRGNGNITEKIPSTGEWSTVKVTLFIPNNVVRIQADFAMNPNGGDLESESIDIEWVKLEVGEIPTMYIPPNPAEELVKCRWFYRRDYLRSLSSYGYSISNNKVYFDYYFGKMRTTPTCKMVGSQSTDSSTNKHFGIVPGGNVNEGWGISKDAEYIVAVFNDCAIIDVILPSNMTVKNRDFVLRFGENAGIEADAEIY